jgi:hypothetical protein
MNRRRLLIIAASLMFLSSAGIVTFLSAQEGGGEPTTAKTPSKESSRTPDARELTLETRYAPDRILRASGQTVWRASADLGILVSADGGATWSPRNEGLPVRVVYPFAAEKPPVVTGLAVDPLDPGRVAFSTPDTLYLSGDGGASWGKLELKDPIRANDQVTCLTLCPGSPERLAIGTSFHGFFETANRGKTWAPLSEPVTSLAQGSGNSEEIAAIVYDPADTDLLWIGLGFGKGLFTYRHGAVTLVKASLPEESGAVRVRDLSFHRRTEKEGWRLEMRTDAARWENASGGAWKMIERIGDRPALSPDKERRMGLAADKYGIYVSSFYASGTHLQNHLNFIKAQGMNSMVVDFKDDNGYLTYNTALAEPARIGAVRKRFVIEDIVATAHANGLYLIGRIVVFRDKQLYNAEAYTYAAWDKAAKGPWRYLKKGTDGQTGQETLSQGEYWVDPYSEHVWDYNIAIARELQDKGVDEVQFDYIRFPSDGDIGGITWRFRKPGMGKREALESFLTKARENLSLPLSTDVYGYCGWSRISNWVAQNIEMFSQYVDVIQPMFYPSHFPRDFLGSMEYLPRAAYLYNEGTRRAADIVAGRSIIRPYVQAFRLGGELNFTPAVYSAYLQNQVRGALAGEASGFTLWNASNDYYMVTAPLGSLIGNGARTGMRQ